LLDEAPQNFSGFSGLIVFGEFMLGIVQNQL